MKTEGYYAYDFKCRTHSSDPVEGQSSFIMVERMGIEPIDNCLQGNQEPQLNHTPWEGIRGAKVNHCSHQLLSLGNIAANAIFHTLLNRLPSVIVTFR